MPLCVRTRLKGPYPSTFAVATASGKIIAVLGFAFKKNTSDAQESPAIEVLAYCRTVATAAHSLACPPTVPRGTVAMPSHCGCCQVCKALLAERAVVCVYDPQVSGEKVPYSIP